MSLSTTVPDIETPRQPGTTTPIRGSTSVVDLDDAFDDNAAKQHCSTIWTIALFAVSAGILALSLSCARRDIFHSAGHATWISTERWLLILIGCVSIGIIISMFRHAFLFLILHLVPYARSRVAAAVTILGRKVAIATLSWWISAWIIWELYINPNSKVLAGGLTPDDHVDLLRRLFIIGTVLFVAMFAKSVLITMIKHHYFSYTHCGTMVEVLMSHTILTHITVIMSTEADKDEALQYFSKQFPIPVERIAFLATRLQHCRNKAVFYDKYAYALTACTNFLATTKLPLYEEHVDGRSYKDLKSSRMMHRMENKHAARELCNRAFTAAATEVDGLTVLRVISMENLLKIVPLHIAEYMFNVLCKEPSATISIMDLQSLFLSWYYNAKTLAMTLQNTGTVIRLLDILITGGLCVILAMVSLLIAGIPILSVLLPMSTIIVAFSFLFGNLLRTFFESTVFLLAMHPFDAGDTIYVDDVRFKVRQLYILSTVLQRWDGQCVVYPNSELMKKQIINVRRSEPITELMQIHIPVGTPASAVVELQHMLRLYVSEHSHDWESVEMSFSEYKTDKNALNFKVWTTGKTNWHYDKRYPRLHAFLQHVSQCMVICGIVEPPSKSTTVSVGTDGCDFAEQRLRDIAATDFKPGIPIRSANGRIVPTATL